MENLTQPQQPSQELKTLFNELVEIETKTSNRDWAILVWSQRAPFNLFDSSLLLNN